MSWSHVFRGWTACNGERQTRCNGGRLDRRVSFVAPQHRRSILDAHFNVELPAPARDQTTVASRRESASVADADETNAAATQRVWAGFWADVQVSAPATKETSLCTERQSRRCRSGPFLSGVVWRRTRCRFAPNGGQGGAALDRSCRALLASQVVSLFGDWERRELERTVVQMPVLMEASMASIVATTSSAVGAVKIQSRATSMLTRCVPDKR